ncbi:MAG: NAD-dependent epimerase/dehydratase family protein [Gemmatimonadota bacterium]
MRYLVTGGGGFIGSHLSEHLLEEGHEVLAVDNFSTGRPGNVAHLEGHPGFELTEGDVMEYPLMEELVADCDAVYHLAAAVGVKLIMDEPVDTLTTNVRGTEIMLDLCSKHDRRIFLASTSEVYGKTLENNGDIHALREDEDRTLGSTDRKRWAYACSKAFDEFLALAFREERGLDVVIGRFFNTVGPRQTGRYGMVIPTFVRRALEGKTLEIHGDGEQSRSFTHVDDAVWAAIRLMELDGAEGEVYNIGHGDTITINELAERVVELTDSGSEITHVPYEQVYGEGFEDMRRRTPDISKLRETIGYEPRLDIDDILEDVIAHERSALEAARTEATASPPAQRAAAG